MKFNCNKCETTMEVVEDTHVCPDCDNKMSLDEANDLFEEGKIVGVVEDSDNLDEMEKPFDKKDKKKSDGDDDEDMDEDADKKDKKKKDDMDEGENPFAKKGDADKKDKKKDDKKSDEDDDDEDMDEDFDINSIKIDVSEDVSAIFNGESLSEDFKAKATTIFEAAVASHVKKHLDEIKSTIKSNYDKKLVKESEKMEADIETFLEEAVKEWKSENELAIEAGVRTEMTENFIMGLKELFEDHYVDIPEDRYDLVDNLSEQVKDLRTKLDATLIENVELKKSETTATASDIQKEMSEGLAESEIEKFQSLAENVDFVDADQYRKELNTLKESYFAKSVNKGKGLNEDVDVGTATNENIISTGSAIKGALAILSQKD